MLEFEELIESWINGNRSHVWEEFQKMTPGQKVDFVNYLDSMEDRELFIEILKIFIKNYV